MGSQLATRKNGCLSGTNYRITFLTYFIYFCMNNSCWQSNERNVQNNFFLFHRTKETDHWQLEVLWLKRRCMLSYFYALPKAPTMCYWHRSHPTYYQRLLHPLKCEQRSIELFWSTKVFSEWRVQEPSVVFSKLCARGLMSDPLGICISNRRKEVRQAESNICLPSAGKLLDVKHTEVMVYCSNYCMTFLMLWNCFLHYNSNKTSRWKYPTLSGITHSHRSGAGSVDSFKVTTVNKLYDILR